MSENSSTSESERTYPKLSGPEKSRVLSEVRKLVSEGAVDVPEVQPKPGPSLRDDSEGRKEA